MQPGIRRTRRAVAVVVLVASMWSVQAADVGAATPVPPCGHPVLVLAAMPLELYPLIQRASVHPVRVVHVNERTFYVGRLAGNDVVLAMTGIDLGNAAETATAAFEHLRCPFTGAASPGLPGASRSSAT